MSKQVYIIHGWGGGPENSWFPWLKKELESRSFHVEIPAMPTPNSPKKSDWFRCLQGIIEPDERTFLVGHSIGCMAIMRYLESFSVDKKVGGVVFVGAWFKLKKTDDLDKEDSKLIRDWLNPKLNFEKIKKAGSRFSAIFSDNDYFVSLDNQIPLREELGAHIIIESGKGHFDDRAGVTELPSVLEELLKMTGKDA